MIHDRDTIFSAGVDRAVAAMGLTVLKTPVRAPRANAFCERLVGTMRRECLDFVITLKERHLRYVLQQWVEHYNRGRPHASLGPGLPDLSLDPRGRESSGHRMPPGYRVVAAPVLAGCITSIVLRRSREGQSRKAGAHDRQQIIFAEHSLLHSYAIARTTLRDRGWQLEHDVASDGPKGLVTIAAHAGDRPDGVAGRPRTALHWVCISVVGQDAAACKEPIRTGR